MEGVPNTVLFVTHAPRSFALKIKYVGNPLTDPLRLSGQKEKEL